MLIVAVALSAWAEPGSRTSEPAFGLTREAEAPVVGGEPSAQPWPELAAIFTLNSSFGCTGTRIARDLVLTAGHCGFGMTEVLIGQLDYSADLHRAPILEGWVHPEYFTTYDVAVYRFDPTGVPEGSGMPLVRDCEADVLLDVGVLGRLVGYGALDAYANERTTRLHEADVPIHDPACLDPGRACNPAVSPGGELWAGGDGVDSCLGDSGGPLFVAADDGWRLAGVVSRAATPKRTPCGDGGIYVRADAVADWIEQVTGEALAAPDCAGVNRRPSVAAGAPIEARRAGPAVGTALFATDPDDGDRLRLSVVGGPGFGRSWIDGDRLVYQPTLHDAGETAIVVRVTDEAGASADLTVAVRVDDVSVIYPERAGCRTAPGPAWLVVGVVGALRRRARQVSDAS